MDINQVIQELYRERNKLDALIKILEQGLDPLPSKKKKSPRGRKFMSAKEREEVAERMRKYWANRKAAKDLPTPAAPPEKPRDPTA